MKEVFDRNSSNSYGREISDNMYNFIIGATLCWGFGINWFMVKNIPVETIMQFGFWPVIIGYFILCFAGIAIFTKSSDPWFSFLGYNLIVCPFGLIINIVVSQYDSTLVLEAIQVTGLVTLVMMIAGSAYPAFFKKIISVLTIALFAVIIVEMIMIFVFKTHHGIIDWIVVVIFCGYIGYDWGRAQRIPKTVDNAVDSAASLYMDIINLFLRILRIMGRK